MRIFKNFNIGDFCNDLNLCDWVSIEQFEDVDETYRRFKDLFTQVCDKHCPFLTRRVTKSFLPYLTEENKEHINMKHYFQKRNTLRVYKFSGNV